MTTKNKEIVQKNLTISQIRFEIIVNKRKIKSKVLNRTGKGDFLVRNIHFINDRKKKNKMQCQGILSDRTGEINFSIQNCSVQDKELLSHLENQVIHTKYQFSVDKEKPSLILRDVHILPRGTYKRNDFVANPKLDSKKKYEGILRIADHIRKVYRNKGLCELIQAIYKDNEDNILTYPLTRFVDGVAISSFVLHVWYMIAYSDGIIEANPMIRADLLLAGIMLHDIGEIKEFEVDDYGVPTEYADKRNRYGHSYLGAQLVESKIDEINEKHGSEYISNDDRKRLVEMILTHHGYSEYGNVDVPSSLEAKVLYQLNIMDEQMEEFYTNSLIRKNEIHTVNSTQ